MNSDQTNEDLPLRSLYADDDMIAEILPAFVNNMPKYVGDLRTLISSGNFQAGAKVCHDLKGTAGGYGYPQIGTVAQKLEEELKGAKQASVIHRLIEDVSRLCHQARLGLPH